MNCAKINLRKDTMQNIILGVVAPIISGALIWLAIKIRSGIFYEFYLMLIPLLYCSCIFICYHDIKIQLIISFVALLISLFTCFGVAVIYLKKTKKLSKTDIMQILKKIFPKYITYFLLMLIIYYM
jgi:hypothetical protein